MLIPSWSKPELITYQGKHLSIAKIATFIFN
jgi:hypothetical protein